MEARKSQNCSELFPAGVLVQSATHRYSAEGLEFQEGQVLGQLNGLQVVEEERDLPLFAGSDLLAGLHRPVPFISGITRHN